MPNPNRFVLPSFRYWGLLVTIAVLFMMGGSARGDVQSMAILNPVLIICCGTAILTLRQEHWQEKKWLLIAFAAVFFLTALYIIPLPMEFEQFSRNGAVIDNIRVESDATDAPRILATAPFGLRQAFLFLFAPLAVTLFALQLELNHLSRTLPAIIMVGAFSGLLGVLQLAGSTTGALYFYEITNNGSAVGLFANRNHAAVFLACLFPMLAVFAVKSQVIRRDNGKTVRLLAMAIAVLLVPLILVTGSRSGLITAIIGLVGGIALYISHAPSDKRVKISAPLASIMTVVVLFCLVSATIYFSRAEAIERIFSDDGAMNDRADYWSSGFRIFWQYFPLGFGPGAFVPVFQMEEPSALLSSAYLNRLHNDWLETALAFGLPGILLLLCATAYFVWRFVVLWIQMDGRRTSVALGRMASVIIIILGIASTSDYPLRTPAMVGFFALVLVWFSEARRDQVLYT